MRTIALVCGVLACLGCESARERCDAAREAARAAWGPAVDGALAANQAAQAARERAIQAVTEQTMDLGNVRSEAAEARFGVGDDAFVGFEVSVGAVIAAMLAADGLWATDAAAAETVAAEVSQELDGRFAELMTAPLDAEGARERMVTLGDGCSTTLQLLVREQPEAVRAAVLRAFQALEAGEGEPAPGVDLAGVSASFRAYLEAAREARRTQDALDAAVAAREAVTGPAAAARERAAAAPDGLEGLAAARAATEAAASACDAR